ncbi:MAG: ATP-binding domain-containing protein [Crocinitomicaceae bacterium]|nr:ATP-binding domain-containing protein [Crocinitomicaceae bacterium]
MFELKPIKNEYRTVYIVDEASMISDENIPNESFAQFGSGNLLEDLLKYDPLGKFIFVGDPCQLPPVGQFNSPALSSLHLESKYGIKSDEFELTDIIRQGDQNGIVSLSFQLRHLILNPEEKKFASFPAKGNSNINFYKTQTDLVEEYIRHLKAHGLTRSSLICQTNQQCWDLNAIIRSALYPESAVLHVGDLLMVTQNNIAANLVNGDQVTIAEIGERQSRCNLVFIRVKVKELFSEKTHDLFLIEDILKSGATNLTNAQQKELFLDFFKRMQAEGIKQKSTEFEEKMLSDKYLNAIRSVYGYVLTCHKTQGGEWEEIFLFLDNKIHGIPKPGIYQWWYTAVTRARKTLHLVDDWFVS